MIGSLSLHRVTSMMFDEAKICYDGYARHLMIRLADGTEIELILFGDTPAELEIRSGTYNEFVKEGLDAKID